ncbi:hypothetical protein KUL118_21550 [Tenacibaculum sp. KUL118]|uniref:Uncharacterized protein n=1 Tax=Tenacibaculum sp. Pbs-1 TaxID=3238748 RepID=A0AB33KV62_9FLAO|nr:hypothetical protein BACT7_28880 [Tenacibaculum mesophilum]BFF41444.1 hypothetical protein BACY1_32490 [Tenacibaculum mesophilum]GFD74523.1 hypothetical protein KUL113_39430 [Tenacibaculum sp. KUL113]GFD79293.1 hypothetical protein KUL118_21550 [Tenacibaculum sp. KUL118]
MVKFLYSATASVYFNCVIVISIIIFDKDIKTIDYVYSKTVKTCLKFVIEKVKNLKSKQYVNYNFRIR